MMASVNVTASPASMKVYLEVRAMGLQRCTPHQGV